MAKGRIRSKNNIKIADLLQQLSLSEQDLYRILKEINVRVEEGQKNLDPQEVASVRRYLNEQQRRSELRGKAIGLPSIVKAQELAKRLELSVGEILAVLLKNGVTATLNDDLDYETAAIIAADLGYQTEEVVEELEKDALTPEKLEEILKKENTKEQEDRPPVVTIMGHVDHGKTTLLDSIRTTNVAKGEAGGITQAISSYQVEYKDRTITFIDTPGHETFEFMRKRGASLADIAILVVAADDGVKPQTKEAVKHARAAGVPIVVAINKIDKEGANLEKVKTELSELDLQAEEWGGKTVVVPVSALKKEGIDNLLEMVLLTADIDPPKAIHDRLALGSVVESRLDKNLGPLATVLVHTGTLKLGDNIVAGKATGRIRRMIDFLGKPITKAGPSTPVTIVGLGVVPQAGDVIQAVEETSEARLKAASRRAPVKKLTSGDDEGDERQKLALVIIADSQGSLEAITQTVEAMVPSGVRLSILRAEVGTVTESDILTAAAAGAIVYAFNTNVSGMSRKLADKEKVAIKSHDVIYRLSEDVREELEKRLPTETVVTDIGKLKVLKVFFSTPKKKIVGGEVAEGKVLIGAKITAKRPSLVAKGGKDEDKDRGKVGAGEVTEMQREKTAIKEARKGDQVGLTIEGKGKIKVGDVLDIYTVEEVRKPYS